MYIHLKLLFQMKVTMARENLKLKLKSWVQFRRIDIIIILGFLSQKERASKNLLARFILFSKDNGFRLVRKVSLILVAQVNKKVRLLIQFPKHSYSYYSIFSIKYVPKLIILISIANFFIQSPAKKLIIHMIYSHPIFLFLFLGQETKGSVLVVLM